MQLRAYLKILTDHLVILIVAAIGAAAVAYALTPRAAQYNARATLYIGTRSPSTDPASRDLTVDRVAALDRAVKTFAAMIDSEPIAAQALSRIGLNRSPSNVVSHTQTVSLENTQLLYIYVQDPSPAVARRIANGLADTFVEAVQQFEPNGREGQFPTLPAYIFERARLPTSPQPTKLVMNLLIAVILGVGAAVTGVLLADHLDVTVRSVGDAERRLRLPVLGVIPLLPVDSPGRVRTPAGVG